MKFNLLIIVITLLVTSGCAFYGSEAQYDLGDWYGLAFPEQVIQIKRNKLALKKLESQNVLTMSENGIFQGYKGIVNNFSRWQRADFHIIGPEILKVFCAPEDRKYFYLLPGEYEVVLFVNGKLKGKGIVNVGPEIKYFMGEQCHWYVYYDP